MINQLFAEEAHCALQELCLIELKEGAFSDAVGLFNAGTLFLDDIRILLDDDYIFSLYMLERQVEIMAKLIVSATEADITGCNTADTVEQMVFATKNYRTLCAILLGEMKQRDGEDPNDTLAFSSIAPTRDDLNRLASRDEYTISTVLGDDEFNALGDDYAAMLEWAQSRRFSQVPSSGRYPLTDPHVDYVFADMGEIKGKILPMLENKLEQRSWAVKGVSLQETLGGALTLERYCMDRGDIISLGLRLKFSVPAFLPWFEKALNEQYRNVGNLIDAMQSGGKSDGKRVYREDVIAAFESSGIVKHAMYKATVKLIPFSVGDVVVAVEMAKFGSLFLPKYINGKDISSIISADTCSLYPAVTSETKPYGRNSNLRQIAELAWCDLVKVRLRNQQDLDRVISFLISA
ncbi:hypothetical protein L4C36_17190 [Photobacterium japonica]|uniref:hypothetical protein n=1 Tax=Photobacterium japonica TaxID=2910235 RepID=UPI003D0CFE46